MKWKIAAAGVAVTAIISAPIVAAAPGGNGKKPGNPGNTISQIAKNGGGVVAIKSALAAAKPNNKGRQRALERVTANQNKTKTTTPSPTTQTTTPSPTTQTTTPAPTTTDTPAPTTTDTPAPTTTDTPAPTTTETPAP